MPPKKSTESASKPIKKCKARATDDTGSTMEEDVGELSEERATWRTGDRERTLLKVLLAHEGEQAVGRWKDPAWKITIVEFNLWTGCLMNKGQLKQKHDQLKRIHTTFMKALEQSGARFSPGPPPRVTMTLEAWQEFAENATDLKENEDLVEYRQNYPQETDQDTDDKDKDDLDDDEDPSAPVRIAAFDKLADALVQGLMGRVEMALDPVDRALCIVVEDGFTDAERADLAIWLVGNRTLAGIFIGMGSARGRRVWMARHIQDDRDGLMRRGGYMFQGHFEV
ncbi:hypothetical protein HDU93_002442 [Gonapodya sp. JEL0774]|nr:hypothetical protein HDU93_002442 [Gonapodya sp. JEL0774]